MARAMFQSMSEFAGLEFARWDGESEEHVAYDSIMRSENSSRLSRLHYPAPRYYDYYPLYHMISL